MLLFQVVGGKIFSDLLIKIKIIVVTRVVYELLLLFYKSDRSVVTGYIVSFSPRSVSYCCLSQS